ncbi:MAG: ATP-binding protein [Clostridiales bacterium]|nr:ATP-binding protein [Clostridiales bacterium]
MTTLADMFDRLHTRTEPREDEYVGDNGLLYCKKCDTPVQCRVSLEGTEHIFPCLCQCRKEKRDREAQLAKEQERMINVQRLKATGIQEKHLLDWRFEVAKDTPSVQMARRYVNSWKKVKAENLGLLFWGDVGTGKSFLAACIANALIEQNVPVLMTNFSKILGQMGGFYSDERYQYIASFSHFPLLILDDLGIERNTEYALEQVYAVIDERYKSGLPVIITTNLTIQQIRNPSDVAHARIFSRVLEMCTPVHIGGDDQRTAIGRGKQAVVKNVLFPEEGGDYAH